MQDFQNDVLEYLTITELLFFVYLAPGVTCPKYGERHLNHPINITGLKIMFYLTNTIKYVVHI